MAGLDQGTRPDRHRRGVGGRGDQGRTARGRQGTLSDLVLDASAIVDILADAAGVNRLTWRMKSGSPRLHSPALCDLEVASYLRRKLREGAISESDAQDFVARLLAMPIERVDHRPLLGRILQLRDRLSAYDAAYVALAETRDAQLATTDRALAGIARDLGLEVVGPTTPEA